MDKKGNNLVENRFELSLIIIAILIPVFLDSFPKIINLILEIFPILTNLSLNLIKVVSMIIGLSWLFILLIGLWEFEDDERKKYYLLFKANTRISSAKPENCKMKNEIEQNLTDKKIFKQKYIISAVVLLLLITVVLAYIYFT